MLLLCGGAVSSPPLLCGGKRLDFDSLDLALFHAESLVHIVGLVAHELAQFHARSFGEHPAHHLVLLNGVIFDVSVNVRLVVEEYYRERRVSVTTSSITAEEFERHMKRATNQVDCKVIFDNLEEEDCLAKVIRESKPYPKNYIAYYYDESRKITEMYKEANKIKASII